MIEELKVETTEERREEEKRMKKKRGISRNCPYAVCSSSVRLVPRDILDGFLFPFIELSLVYVSISPIGPSNASFRFVSFRFTAHIIGLSMLLLLLLLLLSCRLPCCSFLLFFEKKRKGKLNQFRFVI